MHTKTLITIVLILTLYTAYGQNQDWNHLLNAHISNQRKGMLLLGAWGLGNTIAGGIGMMSSRNPEVKAFHQMNLGWGIINTAIAGYGYYSAGQQVYDVNAPLTLLLDNQKLKTVLLLNTGLDAAYMVSGLYLTERSKNTAKNPERLKGFGKSILMQGAFLFVFDIGMYLHFNHHTNDIIRLFSENGMTGIRIKL